MWRLFLPGGSVIGNNDRELRSIVLDNGFWICSNNSSSSVIDKLASENPVKDVYGYFAKEVGVKFVTGHKV